MVLDAVAAAAGLARIRLDLEGYQGEYREAAEEAAKMILLIEESLIGMDRCWLPSCRSFLRRVVSEVEGLLSRARADDPPSLLSETVRPAKVAALGYLAAQAAGRIYGVSVGLAALIAVAAFVLAVWEAPSLAAVAASAAGLGLAVAAALLYSFTASVALAPLALAIQAVAVPDAAPAAVVGVGLVAAGYIVASRLVSRAARVAEAVAGGGGPA